MAGVTSHDSVYPRRWFEPKEAFKDCNMGLVYVIAFPDHAECRKNTADIASETEVWIADNSDHMIHFNSERFPGSHEQNS